LEKIRKNPLKRALRPDKVTLAGLAAVLRLYLDPERLPAHLPALRLLTRSFEEIREQAERVRPALAARLGNVQTIPCESEIGSGALPTQRLASAGLAIRPGDAKLAARFRALPIPVIGRLQEGAFILDLRCLEDEAAFLSQLQDL
jgi:L-seryl-tRNA(Ser) seleniumtransferase